MNYAQATATLLFLFQSVGLWSQRQSDFYRLPAEATPENGFFFCLPRTALEIECTISENRFIPGELSSFTERYFQTGAQNRNHASVFNLDKVAVKPISIPDPAERYGFSASTAAKLSVITQRGGIIKSLNVDKPVSAEIVEQNTLTGFQRDEEFSDNRIPFFSLGTKSDTVINREITADSTIIERRIINRRTVSNSPEEMAKEAIKKIDDIRNTRYMLVSAPEDVELDGSYVEASLRELEKTEQDLLALFFGRNQKIQQTYRVNYIPGESPDTLFFLSKQNGINMTGTSQSQPVLVTLNPFNSKYQKKPAEDFSKGGIIPYRIPEKMVFSLIWGTNLYLETELLIPQFGITKGVQVKKPEELRIIYDATGGIEFTGPREVKK
jgi:hypothetical protein